MDDKKTAHNAEIGFMSRKSMSCRHCGEKYFRNFKEKKLVKTKRKKFRKLIFKTDDGHTLYWSSVCLECQKKIFRRFRGAELRSESTKIRTVLSRRSEEIAGRLFESLGMAVTLTENFGPDIVARIGGLTWTIEVKTVCHRVREKSQAWYIDGVTTLRAKDDLVAIVFPCGKVYIDSMEENIKNSARYRSKAKACGQRTVTKIAKELGLWKPLRDIQPCMTSK